MILLPEAVWETLIAEFARSRRRVEQVAFLDGIELGGCELVTTLTFPNAVLRPRNFAISSAAMSEAGQHLSDYVRIAQVHTHPGDWVGHSEHDDDFAYSRHEGAISIVIPNYGTGRTGFASSAVHVFRAGNWDELRSDEKADFITLIPSKFDFRR